MRRRMLLFLRCSAEIRRKSGIRRIRDQGYLSFRQAQVGRELCLPPDGDVPVEVKLLLQLQTLVVGIHHPVLFLGSRFTFNKKEQHKCKREMVRL
jgi:hypothetical protein